MKIKDMEDTLAINLKHILNYFFHLLKNIYMNLPILDYFGRWF